MYTYRVPGFMNMPRLRGIRRPPPEWAASSSGPRYASVSTMWPRSSVPSSSRQTRTCPRNATPGGRQAGQRSPIPAAQSGSLGGRNRCCAAGPGSPAAPSRAPQGTASGPCPVGSHRLPPTLAAFFGPSCGCGVGVIGRQSLWRALDGMSTGYNTICWQIELK